MAPAIVEDPDLLAVQHVSAVPIALRVIGQMTGLRLALVARVTDDMWKACAVLDRMGFGMRPGKLLDVATTLCAVVRDTKKPIIIDCASQDPVYCGHPTPKMYGFESYISVPIFTRDETYFGNICALDSRPMQLKSSEALSMMELYAELIGLQLDAEARHQETHSALLDARETAKLREQFIAILGHDIRTPVSAIMMGASALHQLGTLDERGIQVVQRITRSGDRISRLVDDVLDFARGRLGGGITLARHDVADLTAVFAHVVDEARATHPGRTVRVECPDEIAPLSCDRDRLAQVLSNLLGNALEHSPAESPVDVRIWSDVTKLELRVSNRGQPIPEDVRARLFLPFERGGESDPNAGLGLGLYIVAQVVQSHGGTVDVQSSQACTVFICTFPRSRA